MKPSRIAFCILACIAIGLMLTVLPVDHAWACSPPLPGTWDPILARQAEIRLGLTWLLLSAVALLVLSRWLKLSRWVAIAASIMVIVALAWAAPHEWGAACDGFQLSRVLIGWAVAGSLIVAATLHRRRHRVA